MPFSDYSKPKLEVITYSTAKRIIHIKFHNKFLFSFAFCINSYKIITNIINKTFYTLIMISH